MTPDDHTGAPDFTVTNTDRREAITALGLDPDLTVSASIASDWLTALVISTDEGGHPRVDGGSPVTHTVSVPITRPDSA